MALSVEKLLADSHTLILRLKDHDNMADTIIATTQTLYNKVEGMKQYQDDITELNEIAKHRPRSTLVLGIAQENRQIRELQQENRELQAALEEHQSALELIMQKYREHTVKLLQGNRMERTLQEKEALEKESMCQLMTKVDEMAGVMQKAIEVDESVGCEDRERLSRLEIENKGLRELLEICTTANERIIPGEEKIGVKKEAEEEGGDDDDDDNTDTECDTTILAAPPEKKAEEPSLDKNVEEEKKEEKGEKEEDKKKKKSPDNNTSSKESTSASSVTRGAGSSKSNTEIRKGKASSLNKTEGAGAAKKTVSSPTVKKEGVGLKKSPSTETKKDLKGKATPKTAGKK